MLRGLEAPLMFDFSSPEQTLQLLYDGRRSRGDGPGVSELALDEQSLEELRNSLTYLFGVAMAAKKEHTEAVQAAAKEAFDECWKMLIEVDDDFKAYVISGKSVVALGDKDVYVAYAKGETSEL